MPQLSGDGHQMLECNGSVKSLPTGSKWSLKIADKSGIPFVVNEKGERRWCMTFFQTALASGAKSNLMAPPDLDIDNATEKSTTTPVATAMPGQATSTGAGGYLA